MTSTDPGPFPAQPPRSGRHAGGPNTTDPVNPGDPPPFSAGPPPAARPVFPSAPERGGARQANGPFGRAQSGSPFPGNPSRVAAPPAGPQTGGVRPVGSGTATGPLRPRPPGGSAGTVVPAGKPRRRRPRLWRRVLVRILQVLGVLFLLGTIATATALAVVYNRVELSDKALDTSVTAQTSRAYYADGTLMAEWAAKDRTIVTTDQIPEHVKNAFIAAEDRSFRDNRGVDARGIARAVWGQVTGNEAAGGGSTITQQYVRNTYDDLTARTWQRKGEEIILAVKVDRRMEKDDILTAYLNTIYFGRLSYGIEAAAQTYFGVGVGQLTPSQAALLAGILPAPVDLDPAVDPAGAEARFDYVVGGLVAIEAITQAEAATFVFPGPEVLPVATDGADATGSNGYLKFIVEAELARKGYTEDQIATGGLAIATTFSPAEQQRARDSVLAGLEEPLADTGGAFPPGLRAGLVSIDPTTGEVRAVYAGEGPERADQADAVTFMSYQAGSTLKPFALVAGLQQGKTLQDTYNGRSSWTTDTNPPFTFTNSNGRNWGRIDLVTATANSVNTVYAQLNNEIKPSSSYQVMVDAGILPGCRLLGEEANTYFTNCTQDLEPGEVGNILGSAAPHLIDVAQAYATIAANGIRRDWHVVREIKGPDGAVIYAADTAGRQVFDPAIMADTTYALTQVVERGSGRAEVGDLDRPVAGKTGTSTDNIGVSFAGYTPQLVTVAALFQMGGENGTSRLPVEIGDSEVFGGTYPARIFARYMESALAGAPVLDFPEPSVKPRPQRTAEPTRAPTTIDEPTTTVETTSEPSLEPTTTEPTETSSSESPSSTASSSASSSSASSSSSAPPTTTAPAPTTTTPPP